MAVGNLILSIPLARKHGALGAAIGTALSYFFGNGIVMNWYNHTQIGLDIKYFWKEILRFIPAFIVPIVYGSVINRMVDLYAIGNLILYGLIYVVLFLISMWFLGLNTYEKNLVKSPFK